MLKLFVYAPNKQQDIERIINAASEAGAGIVSNYTGCAFITTGVGNWLPQNLANPTIGKVGEYSHEEEVKIEMICPDDKASAVKAAILKVHPYEEPEINFIRLVDIE